MVCDKEVPCYYFHASREYGMFWGEQPEPPKPRSRAQAVKNRVKVEEMASRALKTEHVSDSSHSSGREYLRRPEPDPDSAKGRVLSYLRERLDQWVDAPELTEESVGGFAGTRRMRELRDEGWPIETRPSPTAPHLWQHRLRFAG